ncbi:MAG TPA: hypothetical protein VML75_14785 [Kofleriaceae bacterium]|nr:hypothetical protein [Kofleriaceae bacterium]
MSTESNEPGTSPPPQGATEDDRGGGEDHEEHSGLHDIKAMARTTKQRISRRVSTQSDAEESLLASASSQSLSAIVLPEPGQDEPSYETYDEADEASARVASTAAAVGTESRGGLPIWVYGAVGAVAVAAVVFFVMRGGTKQTEVARNDVPVAAGAGEQIAPPASAPSADPIPVVVPAAADDQDPDPATGVSDGDGAGSEGEASAEDRDDDADKPARSRTAPSKDVKPASRPAAPASSTASSSSSSAPAKADASKPTPKAPETAKPKKPDDGKRSLDDLLDEASGGAVSNRDLDKAAPAEPKEPVKTDLSRSEIQTGMKKILARVSACYDNYKEPGTVMVAVVIEPNGEVSSADATGKFKNTETGLCVSEAVRRASFASWEGKPKRFNYPFLLSD